MKEYEAVVIGGGHAGIESAFALARKGHKTILISLTLNALGFMPCNPNVGGTGKGHIVKEVDALGGQMGIVADMATIQTRMLNMGNGPAVRSLRNQVDKNRYHSIMKHRIELQENLDLLEGEVAEILVDKNKTITGVKTALGDTILAKTVVICSGVYLSSKIIIGDYSQCCGPQGYQNSMHLSNSLKKLGLELRRFKTGTPMRVLSSSIDYSVMIEQNGDENIYPFSELTDYKVTNTKKCYLTYTNANTHKIILDNIDRSPLYNGTIMSTGPRYCPSIETKVVKFSDKERHQIFVEPEGEDSEEMYIQGLSTSLPFDVQEAMLHSCKGLENAKILRYGYAIEYDCLNPKDLLPTLAIKSFKGLFSAGQINGTSGYEEAAGQGILAGINAALYLENREPIVLTRDISYIGVLVDDICTKGTDEPYRMMTSRAEYRLFLRQDNADMRLTEIGREVGLVDDERYNVFLEKKAKKEEILSSLKKHYSPKQLENAFNLKNEPVPTSGINGIELLKRSTLNCDDLILVDEEFKNVDRFLLEQVETELKYEGYLKKQNQDIKEIRRLEKMILPEDFDYDSVSGLRLEAREKLKEIKPVSL
ncbi:MAG: tRNA uridine-5-carboxymethylaminomethyl(34) synthesis enzyme MnmG, partial [Clostridia bacterium]|nr:tRNA uridine-5-carboxymethylaminomethyl(34) synthesis enzyme MnmG [Clostridia bacterium]